MNNKKTLILTVLGVLILVIAVVGVTFAMYSFVGTGTKVNVITTGTVSMNYVQNTTIALDNQYPMSDNIGAAQTGVANTLSFTVSATMSGTMTINYELGLDSIVEGATLKDDYIKFNLKKGASYVVGTDSTGVTLASIAGTAGPKNLISAYYLSAGSFNATASETFVLTAWVADDYTLPSTGNTTSGDTQTNTTTSETFSFKVKVVATQA